MKIFIVGSGKLANAIFMSDISFKDCEILKWKSQYQFSVKRAIIVHAGSGRQLKECIGFCARTESPLIELATGSDVENMKPDFPLIICPNTSILVLKILNILKANGRHFENYQVSILESHQSAKKTQPGTAYAFAEFLKLPPSSIVSIRDPQIQLNEIGIPVEYLDKHAYHKIVIRDGSDEITLETKILGHQSYVNGTKRIIEAILTHPLENKKYTIQDLMDMNLL